MADRSSRGSGRDVAGGGLQNRSVRFDSWVPRLSWKRRKQGFFLLVRVFVVRCGRGSRSALIRMKPLDLRTFDHLTITPRRLSFGPPDAARFGISPPRTRYGSTPCHRWRSLIRRLACAPRSLESADDRGGGCPATLHGPPGPAAWRLLRPEPTARPPIVRYEWPCPGQLLHVDTKRLGKFTEPGHALTGDRTHRSRRVGWEFVHSIVGDCSRLAYSEIHDDKRTTTVTAFTRRALDWFLEQGIVAERLMSDNAFAYVHNKTPKVLLHARAIDHIRIRPYTPRTNGKVERY